MIYIMKMILYRIKNEKITSTILIFGLTISFIMVSFGTSFVAELLNAKNDRDKASPPNAYGIVVDNLQYKDKKGNDHIATKEYIKNSFSKLENGTGVILNNIMLTLDSQPIDSVCEVSAEWFKNDNIWHYPLLEGRYYTSDEIKNESKVIILGKELKKYVEEKNGKEYVSIKKKEYSVIGYVGFKGKRSLWDSRIFIPAMTLLSDLNQNYGYDGFSAILYSNKKVINNNVNRLEKFYKNKYKNVEVNNVGKIKNDNIIEDIISSVDNVLVLAILGYLIAIMFTISIVSMWIDKRKYEIAVRKAFGYSNKDIMVLIFYEISGLLFIAMIFALIIQFILGLYFDEILGYTTKIFIQNIIVSFFTIIVTTLITMIFPILKTFKIQPAQIVK